MNQTLLIIVTILSSLSFLIAVVVLIFLLKTKTKSNQNVDVHTIEIELAKSNAEIKSLIGSIEKTIESQVKEHMSNFKSDILKEFKDQSDAETQKLNNFQSTIASSTQSYNVSLTQKVDENLKQIRDKSDEQMQAIHKTMNDLVNSNVKTLSAFESAINKALTEQIAAINTRIDERLSEINQKVNQGLNDGFKGASDSMQNLQKQLGIVQEAQKNINSLQNEISSLNGILSNNQQRGKYGEWQLEMLLSNIFEGGKGALYETQYLLQSSAGEERQLKPDAVIFLDGNAHQQIVPIDSKFSLTGYEELFDYNKPLPEAEREKAKSSFKEALRKRIDETSKYIIKGKTLANAIMFIPNDGVFAYVNNEFPEVISYAQKRSVVLVSPTILRPLLASFRIIQIDSRKSANIAKINEALNNLGKDFERFTPRWEKVNKTIQSLNDESYKLNTTVTKIGSKFQRVQNIDLDEEHKELSTDDTNIDEN